MRLVPLSCSVLKGKLVVIHGPMFSGKSAELIRRLRASVDAGQPTAAYKSSLDARHHATDLSSHEGERFPAQAVGDARKIDPPQDAASVIGIDEVQFFTTDVVDVCLRLRREGHHVLVAGLAEDFRREPFEVVARLIERADEVVGLFARCAVCGGEAAHTFRTVPGEERVVVGAGEAYEPRCSRCFSQPYSAE